jgi:hypothetical protein
MAGHSRSKNSVASLAYVPAIHVLSLRGAEGDEAISAPVVRLEIASLRSQ